MLDKMIMIVMFGSGAGAIGLWLFRRKIALSLCEKLIRSLLTFQLLPALILLQGLNIEFPIKICFVISWIIFTLLLWKTPIFCSHCFGIVMRGLHIPKYCPSCGKKLDAK